MKEYYISTRVLDDEYFIQVTEDQWNEYLEQLKKNRIEVELSDVLDGELYFMKEGEYEEIYRPVIRYPGGEVMRRGNRIGFIHVYGD